MSGKFVGTRGHHANKLRQAQSLGSQVGPFITVGRLKTDLLPFGLPGEIAAHIIPAQVFTLCHVLQKITGPAVQGESLAELPGDADGRVVHMEIFKPPDLEGKVIIPVIISGGMRVLKEPFEMSGEFIFQPQGAKPVAEVADVIIIGRSQVLHVRHDPEPDRRPVGQVEKRVVALVADDRWVLIVQKAVCVAKRQIAGRGKLVAESHVGQVVDVRLSSFPDSGGLPNGDRFLSHEFYCFPGEGIFSSQKGVADFQHAVLGKFGPGTQVGAVSPVVFFVEIRVNGIARVIAELGAHVAAKNLPCEPGGEGSDEIALRILSVQKNVVRVPTGDRDPGFESDRIAECAGAKQAENHHTRAKGRSPFHSPDLPISLMVR